MAALRPTRRGAHARGFVIAFHPQVTRRWSAPAQPVGERGLAPLDADTRARLQARRRSNDPAPRPSRWALLAVLLLHALFVLALWLEMRPAPPESRPVATGAVLQVRLIARRPVPPPVSTPPPLPNVPSRAPNVAPPSREPVDKQAMTADLPAATPAAAPAPRLFDRDGQPLLPASSASTAAAPDYVPRLPQGDARVMRHDDPVKYRSTRFDQYFPSIHETLLGQTVRGVLRASHTGDKKSVDLPGGVHLKCKTLLGIPTPMCQDPPAAPPKKDGGERLSMAPAQPLAKGIQTPVPPSEQQCIALYRDGKPLPWGCPVDTPTRAVDAECVAQYRLGKPLAAHCDASATARRAAQPTSAAH